MKPKKPETSIAEGTDNMRNYELESSNSEFSFDDIPDVGVSRTPTSLTFETLLSRGGFVAGKFEGPITVEPNIGKDAISAVSISTNFVVADEFDGGEAKLFLTETQLRMLAETALAMGHKVVQAMGLSNPKADNLNQGNLALARAISDSRQVSELQNATAEQRVTCSESIARILRPYMLAFGAAAISCVIPERGTPGRKPAGNRQPAKLLRFALAKTAHVPAVVKIAMEERNSRHKVTAETAFEIEGESASSNA